MAFPDKWWRFLTCFMLVRANIKKITGGPWLTACPYIHLRQITHKNPSVIRQNSHAVTADAPKSFGIVMQFGKHLFILHRGHALLLFKHLHETLFILKADLGRNLLDL